MDSEQKKKGETEQQAVIVIEMVYSKDIYCLSSRDMVTTLRSRMEANHIYNEQCTPTPECIIREFWQQTTGFGNNISISKTHFMWLGHTIHCFSHMATNNLGGSLSLSGR